MSAFIKTISHTRLENKIRKEFGIDIKIIGSFAQDINDDIIKASTYLNTTSIEANTVLLKIAIDNNILSYIYISSVVLNNIDLDLIDIIMTIYKQNVKLNIMGFSSLIYKIHKDSIYKYSIHFIGFADNKNNLPKRLKINDNVKNIILNKTSNIDKLEEIILPHNSNVYVANSKYANKKLYNIEYVSNIQFKNGGYRISIEEEIKFYNLSSNIELYHFVNLNKVEFAESCLLDYVNIDDIKLKHVVLNSKIKKVIIPRSFHNTLYIYTPLDELIIDGITNSHIKNIDNKGEIKLNIKINSSTPDFSIVIKKLNQ